MCCTSVAINSLFGLFDICVHIRMHAQVHVNVKCLCGCMRACDSAEATRIVLCHISVHVLEEKKSRPSGWFAVQTNPSQKLLTGLGKKRDNSIVFVSVIREPKPQRVLSPPVLYVKQFKWCNLQDFFFFYQLSFLGKKTEVSSSLSKRGVFSRNCLLS